MIGAWRGRGSHESWKVRSLDVGVPRTEAPQGKLVVAVHAGGNAARMRHHAVAGADVALPLARGPHRPLHRATHLVSDRRRWPARRGGLAGRGTVAAFRRSDRRTPGHPRHTRSGAVGRHLPVRRVLGRRAVRRGDADGARRADLQEQRRRAVHRRPRRVLRVRDQRPRDNLRGLLHLGAGVRVERLRASA